MVGDGAVRYKMARVLLSLVLMLLLLATAGHAQRLKFLDVLTGQPAEGGMDGAMRRHGVVGLRVSEEDGREEGVPTGLLEAMRRIVTTLLPPADSPMRTEMLRRLEECAIATDVEGYGFIGGFTPWCQEAVAASSDASVDVAACPDRVESFVFTNHHLEWGLNATECVLPADKEGGSFYRGLSAAETVRMFIRRTEHLNAKLNAIAASAPGMHPWAARNLLQPGAVPPGCSTHGFRLAHYAACPLPSWIVPTLSTMLIVGLLVFFSPATIGVPHTRGVRIGIVCAIAVATLGILSVDTPPCEYYGAHRDYGVLTLLYPDYDQPGLEFRDAHGEWRLVPSLPSKFDALVNSGETFAFWNPTWKPVWHRVVAPSTTVGNALWTDLWGTRDRYVVAAFFQAMELPLFDSPEYADAPMPLTDRHLHPSVAVARDEEIRTSLQLLATRLKRSSDSS